MKKLTFGIAACILLASCSSNPKKILVFAKGGSTINQESKTITLKDGSGQEEKTLDYNTADKVTISVKDNSGATSIEIPENGYYILNAKSDTLIGSYQKYTDPKLTQNVKTQESLKMDIDSLQQLVEGKNVSAANRNFFVLPKTAVKITDNVNAIVVGPFHQMTSVEKEGDKVPEVYRFWSVKEIRQTIDKLTLLTVAEKK
ncbi:hypothetical protein ACI6Q2_01970 [Chitinophagaceae bacterium LWZ2-11]